MHIKFISIAFCAFAAITAPAFSQDEPVSSFPEWLILEGDVALFLRQQWRDGDADDAEFQAVADVTAGLQFDLGPATVGAQYRILVQDEPLGGGLDDEAYLLSGFIESGAHRFSFGDGLDSTYEHLLAAYRDRFKGDSAAFYYYDNNKENMRYRYDYNADGTGSWGLTAFSAEFDESNPFFDQFALGARFQAGETDWGATAEYSYDTLADRDGATYTLSLDFARPLSVGQLFGEFEYQRSSFQSAVDDYSYSTDMIYLLGYEREIYKSISASVWASYQRLVSNAMIPAGPDDSDYQEYHFGVELRRPLTPSVDLFWNTYVERNEYYRVVNGIPSSSSQQTTRTSLGVHAEF